VPTSLALREKRANLWSQMTEILDRSKDGDLSAEDDAVYTAAEADLDKVSRDIDRQERYEGRSRDLGAPVTTADGGPSPDDTRKAAYEAYMRGGPESLNSEQRTALVEERAQAAGTNSAGGFFVPPAYRDEFIITMKAYGAVQNFAQVITTDTGANFQWPTMNDTSNVGVILAENTAMAELDLTIGTASLNAYMYTSKLTRVSFQLAQDSAFDIENVVQTAHAERIARIMNQHFTTGTGTAQPLGIVAGATTGVTAASATAITSDEMISLQHSVDPAYRASSRAQYMMSDAALANVRKLKDTVGQYIWQPSYQAGVPSSLAGYPVVINNDMAVPATGVKSVLFGDFYAGYVIRLVTGLQRLVLVERYAEYLQNAYASYLRADGTVQNTSAYKALAQL
jgi:HK97 family phage major capsid protein